MIQRIQTIYLLLVALLSGLAFWLPLAEFTTGADTYSLTALGLRNAEQAIVQPTIYLTILQAACCLLPLVTIFLYKRRLLQIRLAAAELVLLLGAVGMTLIYYMSDGGFPADTHSAIGIAFVFPIVSLVFVYLAIRAIGRDERLVRSLDRIR